VREVPVDAFGSISLYNGEPLSNE
jgi:hypothetical protein